MKKKIVIQNIGKAEISKKALICNFSIDSREFFYIFGEYLPNDFIKNIVKDAIDNSGSKIKIHETERLNLIDFLKVVKKIAAKIPKAQSRFAQDAQSDALNIEQMKCGEGPDEMIIYEDRDPSTPEIATYDSSTGKKEGEIVLGPQGSTGKLVPLHIVEKREYHYNFNGETDIEEKRKTSGVFTIRNPSSNNKMWDIDVSFENEHSTSLDESIHIVTMNPEEERVFEYDIDQIEESPLKISEFISTIDDEEISSYALLLSQKNVVLFKIKVENRKDFQLNYLKIKKEIRAEYFDTDILGTTHGSAKIRDNTIVWTIDSLEPNSDVEMTIQMSLNITDVNLKIRSGKIMAEFSTEDSISGLEVDKFDAYSDNYLGMMLEQQDEDPDRYTCSLTFQNESDFQFQLVNLDIFNAQTEEKVLDIDPSDIPVLAAGSAWNSIPWETETENGDEPIFHKIIEFFLIGDRKITTVRRVVMSDIELATVVMDGRVDYIVSDLNHENVNVLLQAKNMGGAVLNEISFKDIIPEGYIPPSPEEIELYILCPQDEQENEFVENENIDWYNLGDPFYLAPEQIKIIPNNQKYNTKHIIRIELKDLVNNSLGRFLPGAIIRAKYTIQAKKALKLSTFFSDVTFSANTYPAGEPVIILCQFKYDMLPGILQQTEKLREEILTNISNASDWIHADELIQAADILTKTRGICENNAFEDLLKQIDDLLHHIEIENQHRKKLQQEILTIITTATDWIHSSEYGRATDALTKAREECQTYTFNDLLKQIDDLLQNIEQSSTQETEILKILNSFALKYSRIHISEIQALISYPMIEVERCIQKLIRTKQILAKYDPVSRGIEFMKESSPDMKEFLETLDQNFEKWEQQEDGFGKKFKPNM